MSLNEERGPEKNDQVTKPSSTPPSNSQPQRAAAEYEEHIRKNLSEINRITIWTNSLVDNGLFRKKHKKLSGKKEEGESKVSDELEQAFCDIQDNLYGARTSLDAGDDLATSDRYLSRALKAYDKALYTKSRLWRFSNVYAGPMWIYLVGFLGAVLAFYWALLDTRILGLNPPGVLIQASALHATTWGTVGAILRGIWFLKDKVSDRRYRNSFRIYLLSAPFLGGLFGAIFYFLLVAGLVIVAPTQAPAVLTNQTSTGSSATATTQTGSTTQANGTSAVNLSSVAIIPFAALAGFNWEWAIMIFKRIGESFKGETEPEDKIER
jgi:hypothetical protein